MAVHFERGREYGRAVHYLGHVAEMAMRRSAPREAIQYLTRGLQWLQTFPNTPARLQQELSLQIPLGIALTVTQGYAAPAVERAYARARALCQQLGEHPHLLPVLLGIAVFHLTRAEFQTARKLGDQLLRLAQYQQDPVLLLHVHSVLGVILFHLGHFTAAREHLEQASAPSDPHQHHPRVFPYAQDPGVLSRAQLAWTLWVLGYPDQALSKTAEALRLAHELSHPYSHALTIIHI